MEVYGHSIIREGEKYCTMLALKKIADSYMEMRGNEDIQGDKIGSLFVLADFLFLESVPS